LEGRKLAVDDEEGDNIMMLESGGDPASKEASKTSTGLTLCQSELMVVGARVGTGRAKSLFTDVMEDRRLLGSGGGDASIVFGPGRGGC
jgi:hypothetical protein